MDPEGQLMTSYTGTTPLVRARGLRKEYGTLFETLHEARQTLAGGATGTLAALAGLEG
jgi:hypothetical protein